MMKDNPEEHIEYLKLLKNLTPHDIVVRMGMKDVTIPPSGTIARVEFDDVVVGAFSGIPIITRKFVAIKGLPTLSGIMVTMADGYNGTIDIDDAFRYEYIVSSMVLDAIKNYSGGPFSYIAPDTGATAIRNEKGQIVAISRFVR